MFYEIINEGDWIPCIILEWPHYGCFHMLNAKKKLFSPLTLTYVLLLTIFWITSKYSHEV
jgi:hypothetical protein